MRVAAGGTAQEFDASLLVTGLNNHVTNGAADGHRLITTSLGRLKVSGPAARRPLPRMLGRSNPSSRRSSPSGVARGVLSSKTPGGVRRPIWAHLLVHHALRELMLDIAPFGTA
ncbi:hypothetical protein [Streptomyces sp. IB201691-2A2]|uniref:hypothetical protein n=1 Tax=Streptomyces sp. IB201691-2A2 TaxID=2561920 RepID=UPI00163D9281|nr:hypothetical protein [Streptomyces sp. IB201691-2A2]